MWMVYKNKVNSGVVGLFLTEKYHNSEMLLFQL